MNSAIQKAKDQFRGSGGIMRTSEALSAGIHPRTLYKMRDSGEVVELSRGVFQLASNSGHEHIDLAAVAKRAPTGVICLISALHYP